MKFFSFRQNNSGGVFQVDEAVAHYVIIQACNAEHANERAENIGIYFNGCEDGTDCPCCGDRWDKQWNDETGTDSPEIYGVHPSLKVDPFAETGEPYCHVYYMDRKETYHKP